MAQHIGTQTSPRKARHASGRNDSLVNDFLDRFARALTAGDTRIVTSMWETPALVVGDEEVRAVSSSQQVEQFFSGAKEQYNSRGIVDTRPEIIRLEWVTDRIVVVEVRWPYIDIRGNEIGEEKSTYTLRRNDEGEFKLRVAITHGAAGTH